MADVAGVPVASGDTARGDGQRHTGRGLLRLTGRANRREVSEALGVDRENDAEALAEPVLRRGSKGEEAAPLRGLLGDRASCSRSMAISYP